LTDTVAKVEELLQRPLDDKSGLLFLRQRQVPADPERLERQFDSIVPVGNALHHIRRQEGQRQQSRLIGRGHTILLGYFSELLPVPWTPR